MPHDTGMSFHNYEVIRPKPSDIDLYLFREQQFIEFMDWPFQQFSSTSYGINISASELKPVTVYRNTKTRVWLQVYEWGKEIPLSTQYRNNNILILNIFQIIRQDQTRCLMTSHLYHLSSKLTHSKDKRWFVQKSTSNPIGQWHHAKNCFTVSLKYYTPLLVFGITYNDHHKSGRQM